jgi:hypothetical protein
MVQPQMTVNQSRVLLLHGASSELRCQVSQCGVRASNQDHTAGVAVQPMHDSGPILPGGPSQGESVQQGVHQGPGVAARAKMHDHAGGLVDGDHGVVLVEHREGYVFGLGPEGRRSGWIHLDALSPTQFERRLGGPSIDAHTPGPDPGLQAGPAELGKCLLEEMVQPAAAGGGGGDK